jgi:hypothetical protein
MPEFGTTMSRRPSLLKSAMATECGRESLLIELRTDDFNTYAHVLTKQDKKYEIEYSEVHLSLVV